MLFFKYASFNLAIIIDFTSPEVKKFLIPIIMLLSGAFLGIGCVIYNNIQRKNRLKKAERLKRERIKKFSREKIESTENTTLNDNNINGLNGSKEASNLSNLQLDKAPDMFDIPGVGNVSKDDKVKPQEKRIVEQVTSKPMMQNSQVPNNMGMMNKSSNATPNISTAQVQNQQQRLAPGISQIPRPNTMSLPNKPGMTNVLPGVPTFSNMNQGPMNGQNLQRPEEQSQVQEKHDNIAEMVKKKVTEVEENKRKELEMQRLGMDTTKTPMVENVQPRVANNNEAKSEDEIKRKQLINERLKEIQQNMGITPTQLARQVQSNVPNSQNAQSSQVTQTVKSNNSLHDITQSIREKSDEKLNNLSSKVEQKVVDNNIPASQVQNTQVQSPKVQNSQTLSAQIPVSKSKKAQYNIEYIREIQSKVAANKNVNKVNNANIANNDSPEKAVDEQSKVSNEKNTETQKAQRGMSAEEIIKKVQEKQNDNANEKQNVGQVYEAGKKISLTDNAKGNDTENKSNVEKSSSESKESKESNESTESPYDNKAFKMVQEATRNKANEAKKNLQNTSDTLNKLSGKESFKELEKLEEMKKEKEVLKQIESLFAALSEDDVIDESEIKDRQQKEMIQKSKQDRAKEKELKKEQNKKIRAEEREEQEKQFEEKEKEKQAAKEKQRQEQDQKIKDKKLAKELKERTEEELKDEIRERKLSKKALEEREELPNTKVKLTDKKESNSKNDNVKQTKQDNLKKEENKQNKQNKENSDTKEARPKFEEKTRSILEKIDIENIKEKEAKQLENIKKIADDYRKIILVVSPESCGKTTVAVNLAYELANRGIRTVLFDTDNVKKDAYYYIHKEHVGCLSSLPECDSAAQMYELGIKVKDNLTVFTENKGIEFEINYNKLYKLIEYAHDKAEAIIVDVKTNLGADKVKELLKLASSVLLVLDKRITTINRLGEKFSKIKGAFLNKEVNIVMNMDEGQRGINKTTVKSILKRLEYIEAGKTKTYSIQTKETFSIAYDSQSIICGLIEQLPALVVKDNKIIADIRKIANYYFN